MNNESKIQSLGRIEDIKLSDVPTLQECQPGFRPAEYNVVIIPAKIVEKTSGGIILSDESRENKEDVTQLGRLVSVSGLAFNYGQHTAENPPPQVGDLVWFARFAGRTFGGLDGKTYRICKDKDIIGVIEGEV